MRTFDDFDAWSDAISGASLRLACDSAETRRWTLDSLDLGGVMLQVAAEGGGNLCYGANTHDGPIIFMPLSHAVEHVVNGERLDDDAFLMIPRGADFRIRIRRHAHAWCSIALPIDAAGPYLTAAESLRIACPPGSLPQLRRLVNSVVASLGGQPAGSNAHQSAGDEIFAAIAACLPEVRPSRPSTGRPRLDRAEIVRNAMAVIEAAPCVPTAADLARHIGVTDRTLLRTFQETYGVPPKRYLLLRELHVIRRTLRAGVTHDATVADVLTRHGIWEFGRFAARYRRQFGELPSETLRAARG